MEALQIQIYRIVGRMLKLERLLRSTRTTMITVSTPIQVSTLYVSTVT